MFENVGARCCQPLRARAESGPGVFSPLLESGNTRFMNLQAIFPRSPKGHSRQRRITSSLASVSARHRGACPPSGSGAGFADRERGTRTTSHSGRSSIRVVQKAGAFRRYAASVSYQTLGSIRSTIVIGSERCWVSSRWGTAARRPHAGTGFRLLHDFTRSLADRCVDVDTGGSRVRHATKKACLNSAGSRQRPRNRFGIRGLTNLWRLPLGRPHRGSRIVQSHIGIGGPLTPSNVAG